MTYITFSINFLTCKANEINKFKKALKEYNLDENPICKNIWTLSIENDNLDEVTELLFSTFRICKDTSKLEKEIKVVAQIGNNEPIII